MTMQLSTDRGRQPPKLVNLTTGGATNVLEGESRTITTIDSISWSVKGTNTTLSLWVTDGVTSAYLMDTEAVSQRTHGELLDRHIQLPNADWVLKAQAGTGNLIDLIVVFTKTTQQATSA